MKVLLSPGVIKRARTEDLRRLAAYLGLAIARLPGSREDLILWASIALAKADRPARS